MSDLLFDTPLWILAVLFIAGAIAWWAGNNRQDKTLKMLGLLGIGVCVALALLSYFVDTDKETAVRQTKKLVSAVNNRDWKTFESVLDPDTSFLWYKNRDAIVGGAKKSADDIGLKTVHALGMDVQQNQTVITIEFSAYSEQDRTLGRPIITKWRFNWQNLGTGWKLQNIVPLKSDQVDPREIEKNLAR